jgi:hypothetical protein
MLRCKRRHVTAARRLWRQVAVMPNQQWAMDFVSHACSAGTGSAT